MSKEYELAKKIGSATKTSSAIKEINEMIKSVEYQIKETESLIRQRTPEEAEFQKGELHCLNQMKSKLYHLKFII